MLRTVFLLALVACLAKVSNSYYTIVSPSYIQSESIYSVFMLSDSDVSSSVELTIANDKGYMDSMSVIMKPHSSQMVDFSIGSLDQATYTFKAEGQNGFDFVNETTLTIQEITTSVFIQTDKAMYKPGDKVQFRVIVVDKNLNPAKIKNMDIYITDGSQNRVDQMSGVTTTFGVYSGEIQLSSTPCLGIWTINVNVNNESAAKVFEVAEYVLPKFEVTVIAPKDSANGDETVSITVKAIYTYGKNVKGAAVLSITGPKYSWPPVTSPIVQSTATIDGVAIFTCKMADLKISKDNWESTFDLLASVTEQLTGIVLEGTATLTIRRNKFTVSNIKNDYSYTPGTYALSLKFAYYDGSPYVDTVNTIKVSYGTNYDQSNSTYLASGKMDSNGVATINVILPDIDSGFYIFVQFQGFNDQVGWYYKAQPAQPFADETSLSVSLLTPNARNGEIISIVVEAANPVPLISYVITARGNLVSSDTIDTGNEKSTTITIKASFAMVPTAQFVAYYISANGDIISGSTEITVKGLNNFVTLDTSAPEKQPGESVDIIVKSKSGSYVCLLGVDQSVVLLKSGNDVQPSEIDTALSLYNTRNDDGDGGDGGPIFDGGPVRIMPIPDEAPEAMAVDAPEGARKKRSIFPPWGGGGGWQMFYNAGLKIFTDCNKPQPIYYRWFEMANAPTTSVPEILATTAAPSSGSEQTESIRAYFPETWIWDCKTVRDVLVKAQAMEKGSSSESNSASVSSTVRNFFPETWIWDFYYRFFDDMVFAEAAMGPAPVADMEGGYAPSQSSSTAVRQFFPETWIYECKDSSTGTLTLNKKAPDTITSWYLTAFATNDEYGLGVTEDKTIFKVFKNFFIYPNIPYSIKRGETFLLQLIVFNYLTVNVTAEVILYNSLNQFEFIDPHTQILKDKGCPPAIDQSRTKSVQVMANNGASVSFLIKALVTGPILIKVSAKSNVAADAIEIPLLVEPEGFTHYKNKAQFVDLRKTTTFTTDLTVDVPKNAVQNSTKIQISVIGDVLGCALQNLDLLIQMPCGCGEQTMLGLAPDVVIYVYLTKVGLMTPALKNKLISYMKNGYQGELSYKHSDNSFSAFGDSDGSGSSWLTAFVLRIFIQASPFITVDSTVVSNALIWLKSQQQADGSFKEPGNVIHTDMQGNAAKGVALSAYVVVTFLADKEMAVTYANVISKALDYVYQTLLTLDDIYSLSIATYAACLAKYKYADALLQKIDGLAKVQGDQKWWEKIQPLATTDSWYQPPSVNVEITGYVLLAYVASGRILEGLPIMKWLLAQQNKNGGFGSTQDTVVGITALATFAAEISGSNVMSCTFNYGSTSTINVDKTNALVLQSKELPATTKSVKVTCTGSGFSLVQLSYQFNLNDEESSPRFVLDVDVDESSNDFNLILNICASYIAGDDGDTSNMALIEAELPSGFTVDLQTTTDALKQIKGFKKVETKKGNTVVVIYLDNVSTTKLCLQITANRLCQIADQKPVAVRIVDYYCNDRHKITFYSITPKDICSICDNDECKSACDISTKDVKCPKKKIKMDAFRRLEKSLRDLLAKLC